MSKLIIDIETIPRQDLPDDQKPQFDEKSVKLGNTKDAEKVEAKIKKARAEFETGLTKKMSIESNYTQILSIGFIEIDNQFKTLREDVLFFSKNDKIILHDFKKIYTGQQIIGWNSKGFDIPVIWKRALFHKIPIFNNYQALCNPYRNDSIDLMRDFNAGGMGKLSEACKFLGIPCKTGLDGSMIYDAWKNKEFDKIIDYNLEDCRVTLEIYKRIYEAQL